MTTTEAYQSILDYANRANPYPFFAELSAEPIQRLNETTWLVSGHVEISRLLRDPRMATTGSARPVPPDAPLGSDGTPFAGPFLMRNPPHHDTLRAQTVHQFVPRILGLRPNIENLVGRLLDEHLSDTPGELDIVAELAYPLPVGVICELLGVPREEEPIFHDFAGRLTRALDPDDTLTEDELAELVLTRRDWLGYLLPMIEQRRADPGSDLISGLLTEGDPETRMNTVELASTLGLLLIAGHETTVNLVANGTLALLRHPEVAARLRADPGLAPAVVEEVLRYDPPVQMTERRTTAPVQVAGHLVPAGDTLVLLLAAGNRDPRRFAEPDRFWPERPDNAHIAFGGGVHYCLGAALARMEAQTALAEIATRLINPRLVVDPPKYRPTMLLRGPEQLRVGFERLVR